jgi:hypothetical protein
MLPDGALVLLTDNLCPDCADPAGVLKGGPRGGMGQNLACVRCGAEFNVVRRTLDHGVPKGEVVMAHRNCARGGPDRPRLFVVFGIALPVPSHADAARETVARTYFDPSCPDRMCEREDCGETYRGPALYCSLYCTLLDAEP